jgi:hypothetical protein
MALVNSIMNGIMNNPDVAAIALALGFAAGYWKARSKYRRGMGGMGM